MVVKRLSEHEERHQDCSISIFQLLWARGCSVLWQRPETPLPQTSTDIILRRSFTRPSIMLAVIEGLGTRLEGGPWAMLSRHSHILCSTVYAMSMFTCCLYSCMSSPSWLTSWMAPWLVSLGSKIHSYYCFSVCKFTHISTSVLTCFLTFAVSNFGGGESSFGKTNTRRS